jgi:hypothetical protein
VLILPPDHQRVARPGRALTRRERRLVQAVGAVTLALVAAVAIALVSSGASSQNGCVHAVFPGPVGAERVDSCGVGARSLCAGLGASGYTGEAARTIASECRKAGLRVGA